MHDRPLHSHALARHENGRSERDRTTRRLARAALGVSAGLGCVAGLTALTGPADARDTLSGQCGVDEYRTSYAIGSDGNLTMQVAGTGKSRAARFRFIGSDSGRDYLWTSYRYRYAISVTNFGPQSNENVRFGPLRNDPGDSYSAQYNSPDNHNSNTGATPPTQSLGRGFTSPGGDTEIWTKAIFDVPNNPDPSCWTNAIAQK